MIINQLNDKPKQEMNLYVEDQYMENHPQSEHISKLKNFDDLFIGDPSEIEKNLRELLPKAKALKDQSIYLQMMARIALTEALQKKFEDAHNTLNTAEKLLKSGDHLARARILLERGRVYQQADNVELATPLFKQSYEISKKHQFDEHMLDAAHMIGIVSEDVHEKIKWNELAIELAKESKVPRGRAWLGPLYHNVGQAYIEVEQYQNALNASEKALEYRKQEGYAPNVRVAKWSVARAMRFLNRQNEALPILLSLVEEYELMVKEDTLDIPEPILFSVRGLVYEELSEIYQANAKYFAGLAYDDLSKDEWFKKLESTRLERLKKLSH